MKYTNPVYSIVATLLTMCMATGDVYASSDLANQDAKAVEVLTQMDSYANSIGTFVVEAESYLDASIGEGIVISNAYETTVSVVPKQSLHSISKSGSQSKEIFVHEGVLTVYSAEQKFFTRTEIPQPLDTGLIYALEELGVETPLLDLLLVNSLEKLVTPQVEVIYVNDQSSIRGVDCHHILLSGPFVDLQIWIQKGDQPLPRRTLMTYRYGEGMPRNEVFLNWRPLDNIAESEFVFVPPEGAIEIGFIDAPVTRSEGEE